MEMDQDPCNMFMEMKVHSPAIFGNYSQRAQGFDPQIGSTGIFEVGARAMGAVGTNEGNLSLRLLLLFNCQPHFITGWW